MAENVTSLCKLNHLGHAKIWEHANRKYRSQFIPIYVLCFSLPAARVWRHVTSSAFFRGNSFAVPPPPKPPIHGKHPLTWSRWVFYEECGTSRSSFDCG